MTITDPRTGLILGDPAAPPLDAANAPSSAAVRSAAAAMILSASGWRTVFAADGNEESGTAEAAPAGLFLAAAAADVFARYILRGAAGGKQPEGTGRPVKICVGTDTRPTGAVLADVIVRRFLSLGIEPVYLFVTAAPEIMAYVKRAGDIAGFAYISASHNPVGHNGFKFGIADGGVLDGSEVRPLIAEYRDLLGDPGRLAGLCAETGSAAASDVKAVFSAVPANKKTALEAYAAHCREVAAGSAEGNEQDSFFAGLRTELKRRKMGIVADLNGSARTVSIDRDFLEAAGLEVDIINGVPGEIAHRIVPEGKSLEPCRKRLEELAGGGAPYILGYVPDNDGDRGNIVYYDEQEGRARSLEAQEVFALALLAETGYLALTGEKGGPPAERRAVVVNGPTSMRIDRIAEAYGVRVARAEVGEANAVHLSRNLRSKGYTVRVLGEGSNGGTIIHPSAVRDPLSTIFALLKLLVYDTARPGGGIIADWLSRRGKTSGGPPGMADIIAVLPPFVTTSAYEPEAIMKVAETDHGLLKARYEEIFVAEWEKRRLRLGEEYGIIGFEEINYEGTEERRGFGPAYRTGEQRGGLKILFTGPEGGEIACMWMRGSGTEPVFRVLVDVDAGTPGPIGKARELHDYLLTWHRDIVEKADR